MKRILLSLLTVLLLVALCACGGDGGSPSATVDMEALQKTMLAADPALTDMTSITGSVEDAKDLFAYLSDFPYDKVENFLLSYSASKPAQEIAVIAVKDPADVTDAATALKTHVDQRLKLFQQYSPADAAQVEKALVFTKDQYAILIISEDQGAVQTAAENFLAAAQ